MSRKGSMQWNVGMPRGWRWMDVQLLELVDSRKEKEFRTTDATRVLRSLRHWCLPMGVLTSNSSMVCFCPSQYYDDKCEYHAERLTVLRDLNLSQSIYVTWSNRMGVLKAFVRFLVENPTLTTKEFDARPTGTIIAVTKRKMKFFYWRSATSLLQGMQWSDNRSLMIHSPSYSLGF